MNSITSESSVWRQCAFDVIVVTRSEFASSPDTFDRQQTSSSNAPSDSSDAFARKKVNAALLNSASACQSNSASRQTLRMPTHRV